ncbi:hypothetical protein VB692_09525 [Planktothrix agardhii UHCC 0887]|nr:hypothetical protein [Planktothrix agardhii UHCC 0887]
MIIAHSCFCDTYSEYLINTSSIALISFKSGRNSVDSDKSRRLPMFGDAIATLNNTTKPTGPSCLGGFRFVENLLTN